MSKVEYYIQPLEQIWAKEEKLYRPKEVVSIDQLDDDLSFKKTIITRNGSDVGKAVKVAVGRGIVKAGGWIRITAEDNAQPEELWPLAMKALGSGETEEMI